MSKLSLDITVTGKVPVIGLPIHEEIKDTFTVPDESETLALPLDLSATFSESGAVITATAKLGPVSLFTDYISIGGTKDVDVEIDGVTFKGTISFTA
jgi:hypothetical protein